eukprot:Hpha_TRINITY_DN26553_c0_g1::TRINITY_DN26553_c0_g1_i1::g.112882::m.112882
MSDCPCGWDRHHFGIKSLCFCLICPGFGMVAVCLPCDENKKKKTFGGKRSYASSSPSPTFNSNGGEELPITTYTPMIQPGFDEKTYEPFPPTKAAAPQPLSPPGPPLGAQPCVDPML